MNNHPNFVKSILLSIIDQMAQTPELYVSKPGKDFTRKRKLDFASIIRIIISMGGSGIYRELLEAHSHDIDTPSSSAFVQQRDKILPSAFEHLFHCFTNALYNPNLSTFHGYRLIAVDGSNLNISTDPNDASSYFKDKPNIKGYNLLHVSVLYDLLNRIYLDADIRPKRHMNEHASLTDMVGRSVFEIPTIVIGDRGYEGYNNFAHIERKGWRYLIRVKDLGSTGILSGLSLPSGGEFDVDVNLILTKKHTKIVRENRKLYKFLSSSAKFDFLDKHDNPFYHMSFRVVRILLENGSFETLVTNLGRNPFPPQTLKQLYKLRWGVETSFRELKYTVGLRHFHAKKRESVIQEIFARIIMYNFTEIITSNVVISKTRSKYPCKVNFTTAVHVCRRFLRLFPAGDNEPPIDVEALIRKSIIPIRSVRKKQYDRGTIRSKSFVGFLYKVA